MMKEGLNVSTQAKRSFPRNLRWEYLVLIGVLVVLGPIMLYFALNENTVNTTVTQADDDATITKTIEINGMHFTPDVIEVEAGEEVGLEIINNNSVSHDLKVGDRMSGNIAPGQSVLFAAGSFTEDTEGWCTVAGHKRQGMTFQIKVV